jgi:hypothetical protein
MQHVFKMQYISLLPKQIKYFLGVFFMCVNICESRSLNSYLECWVLHSVARQNS